MICQNKKTLALLLAALLVAGSLASCGNGNTETMPDTTADTASGANTDTTEETEAPDPFAGTDFGGKSLRLNASADTYDATNAYRFIAGSGEMNGELINDAVFNRNAAVQELLNIKLEFTPTEWNYDQAYAQIEKLVLAGDGQFDVVINDLKSLAQLSSNGYFHSVENTGILDFTKSYWYADAIRDLTVVPGAMYVLLGDYFTDSLASAHVLYYNRTLIENHTGDANTVQDMVLDGKWTVDEMIALKTAMAVDLNGDGKMEEGDQFGYSVIGPWGPMLPVIMGFDVQFIENDNGNIRYCFNNERSVKILEKLNELYWTEGTLQDTAAHTAEDLRAKFANNEAVFVGYLRLSDLENLREVEFPVGLAPYPKLDNAQEHYVSSLHNTTEVGAVFVTVPTDELPFVFTCLEVLGRETGKTVMPTYYEDALKVKYVGGSEDAAMIDLIHDSITSPFALAYNDVLDNFILRATFIDPLIDKRTDFASSYASKESAGQAALDKLVESFRANLS